MFPFTSSETYAFVSSSSSVRPERDSSDHEWKAGWMFFWNREQFGLSQILVCINSFAHLYAVTQLPDINERNALTHWVVKTTAGIGLLDLIDNGGVYMVSLTEKLQILNLGNDQNFRGWLHLLPQSFRFSRAVSSPLQ